MAECFTPVDHPKKSERRAKASLVDRGRSKFKPPKPGGGCPAEKHFPGFRGVIPATSENLYNYQRMTLLALVGYEGGHN